MVETLTKKSKSRNLSLYEYFKILQIEWMVVDLRVKIYYRKKDREYWTKIREFKKKSIEDIAAKNHLPTIFIDDALEADIRALVYKAKSFPEFHYKNNEQQINQGYWDLYNYYSKDAEVRFEQAGEMAVGKVKSYAPYDTYMVVVVGEQDVKVEVKEVTRIL